MERYFEGPYRFIPADRGRFWCRLARPLWGWNMRRQARLQEVRVRGLETLRVSLARERGIILAPNHSRAADAFTMGYVSAVARVFFYYLVSAHALRGVRGAALRRLGAIGILREGADTAAIRECGRILAAAERPLVVFPQGTWNRQNDRLGPFHAGLNLIVRHARRLSDRPVVVHPVAIKYRYASPPAFGPRLAPLERRFSLPAHGDPVERIDRVTEALIARVAADWRLTPPTAAGQDERIAAVVAGRVAAIERHWHVEPPETTLDLRIRQLRPRLIRRLPDAVARGHLTDLLMCENLLGHSWDYLHERPTVERMGEAVERLEETLDDGPERPLAPLHAAVEILPAFEAADDVLDRVQESISAALNRLAAATPPLSAVHSRGS